MKPPVKKNTSLEASDSDASLHCKTCAKSFSNTENLSLHVKSVHGGKKPHKCLITVTFVSKGFQKRLI